MKAYVIVNDKDQPLDSAGRIAKNGVNAEFYEGLDAAKRTMVWFSNITHIVPVTITIHYSKEIKP